MARRKKPPHPAATAQPHAELRDWRGFTARRRSPQFGLLAFLGGAALVSTVIVAQLDDDTGRRLFGVWIYSLVALQVLIVAESRHQLHGVWRRAVPVASALLVPWLVYWALDADRGAVLALAGLFLAIALMPERWFDALIGARRR